MENIPFGMLITDKNYLASVYGPAIGKATVNYYCIKFKSLKDIHMKVLEAAIQYTTAAAQLSN